MTKASRHIWLTALAGVGPRAVAAVALVAAFAFLAPGEGSLDTGHQEPDSPDSGALEDPLGISNAMGGVKDLTSTDAVRLAADAEELSIPPVALAAYQRSSTVLNDADATCRIDWALVAAIGMVESNHGRFGGSELGPNGTASPAIIGAPLDGTNGRAEIHDTDNGLYDHDTVYDRAVGPMQFIPSTWTYAGADGDGDNRRDPQDIDDAAVAGAAYLCAGTEDVSTDTGARTAVFRYNQSETYVDTVLQIAEKYRNGEFPGSATVDGGSPSTMRPTASALPTTSNSVTPKTKTTVKAAPAPEAPEAPAPPKTPEADNDKGDDKGDPSAPPTDEPTEEPSEEPTEDPTEEPPPTDVTTRATLTDPCEASVVKVYKDLLDPVNEVLYNNVIENCIAEFEDDIAMPDPIALDDHLRSLYDLKDTDPTFAELPVPTPAETEAPDSTETASANSSSE